MDASTNPTRPADEHGTLAGTDAASAPARTGFTLRGRTWVYGATLVAAGVLAGSGVGYAVVADSPAQVQSAQVQAAQVQSAQVQSAKQDGQGGPGRPTVV